MPDISFDDLIPNAGGQGSDTAMPVMPGIAVTQPRMPQQPTAADAHPMFADLIPSSNAQTDSANLPSSPSASVSPPDALPANSDDGRSFELRRSSAPPTPDAPTWIGRRVQDIQGRQDPAYADTPSVFSQNSNSLQAPTGSAAMLGATDEQMADVMKKQLGERFMGMTKDANGYPLIQYKDAATGQPKVGYVNKPGLDTEDVVRGIKGALPYAAAGEILGPLISGYSLLSRALMQGGSGAGLSIAGDKALQPLGSEQGVDNSKWATMAMLGPLGEGLAAGGSALWQKFITVPKYFDKSSGQLTPLGKRAAQSLGLDPEQMASDAMSTFGKTYAMNPAAARQSVDAGKFDFNIPATRGQVAKDPQQLLQEKAMRSGVYGLEAKAQVEDLDRQQAEAVARAVTDTIPSRLAGQPWRGGNNPDVYGNNIGGNLADARTNAKAVEDVAWKATGSMTPKTVTTEVPDVMSAVTGVSRTENGMAGADLLKDTLRENLTPYANVVGPENTPTAWRMWSYLNDFMAGKKPSTSLHSVLGLEGKGDIDSVRRAIGLMSKDAQTATDKAASSAIYKSYNDWIDKAADASLLTGDTVNAAKLKAARDVSAEMNSIFRPRGADGKLSPGGKIVEKIAGSADTPERIVQALIPSPNAEIPAGTIEALNLIRRGMQKYGEPGAEGQVWNSIKMSYLSKLTQGRNGEILSPQVMSENLRKAMNSQTTLFDTIYTAADKAVINRFLTQLDRIRWKDPNPSGTATSAAGLMKQLFGKFFEAFGPLGRAAYERSGLQQAWGTAIARQAVKQAPPALPALMPGAGPRYINAVSAPFAINHGADTPRGDAGYYPRNALNSSEPVNPIFERILPGR